MAGEQDRRLVRRVDILRHFRPHFEGAAGKADIGDAVALGVAHRAQLLILQENDDGTETLLVAKADIRPRQIDADADGVSDLARDGLGLAEITAADSDRQCRVEPADDFRRLRSDNPGTADDQNRLKLARHLPIS
ncbi:hypothetical protein D9M72_543850 [compost metagenome]